MEEARKAAFSERPLQLSAVVGPDVQFFDVDGTGFHAGPRVAIGGDVVQALQLDPDRVAIVTRALQLVVIDRSGAAQRFPIPPVEQLLAGTPHAIAEPMLIGATPPAELYRSEGASEYRTRSLQELYVTIKGDPVVSVCVMAQAKDCLMAIVVELHGDRWVPLETVLRPTEWPFRLPTGYRLEPEPTETQTAHRLVCPDGEGRLMWFARTGEFLIMPEAGDGPWLLLKQQTGWGLFRGCATIRETALIPEQVFDEVVVGAAGFWIGREGTGPLRLYLGRQPLIDVPPGGGWLLPRSATR